jgi:hypothetical protein
MVVYERQGKRTMRFGCCMNLKTAQKSVQLCTGFCAVLIKMAKLTLQKLKIKNKKK